MMLRLLATTYYPQLKFDSLILCELMAMSEEYGRKASGTLVKGASARRDIWASKEEAYQLLKNRAAWKVWDDRVLRIFVVCFLQFWY